MSETVVHVKTLEQWKSVLDVWFKRGHEWEFSHKKYNESIFEDGGRFLYLDYYITYSRANRSSKPFIEYEEFMAQQKEGNKMATYYVKEEQLDLIEELKQRNYPLNCLLIETNRYKSIKSGLGKQEEKALLRYLGGDETIQFKVNEQFYRLWRIDNDGDRVYMRFTPASGNPDWTIKKDAVFTAPLEEIKKWKTPSWEIEEAE